MKSFYLCICVVFGIGNQAKAQVPSNLDTIINTSQAPYDKICYLYISRAHVGGVDWYESTGAFIAPNIILTAAHNIHSILTSRVTHITVIPGKYYKERPFDSLVINGSNACTQAIRTHPNYSFFNRSSERMKWDFGIIILPDAAVHANTKLISAQAFSLDSMYILKENDTIHVAGYPADKTYGFHGDYITYQYDLCGTVYPKTFYHRLDTYRGNSGSPIWVNVNGKRVIVGVHTFENAGTKLDKSNLGVLYGWITNH